MTDDPLSLRALPALEPKLERHDLWKLYDGMQMDLRAAQAKMTAIGSKLAALELPDDATARCPRCGIRTKGPRTMAEHVYQSHDGPMPEHWQDEPALLKDSDA